MVQWLSLPGLTGQNVRTPTTTALDVTNDLDIMVRLDADTAAGSANRILIGRQQSASTFALVYKFALTTGDLLVLDWTTAADVDMQATATTTAGVMSGLHWLRATLDVDNGASGYDVKFWYSTTDTSDPDAVSWTQIGSTVVGGAVTNIIDARSSLLEIGAVNSGAAAFWEFDCYRGVVRDGIGGTIIADFNGDDFVIGDSDTDTAVDSTGKTWTIFGASCIIEGTVAPVLADLWLLDDFTAGLPYQQSALPVKNLSVAGVSATATPATVNAVTAIPALTVTASVEKAVATVNIIAAVPAVTKTATAEVLPATVNAVTGIPTPVTIGGTTATPATINIIAAVPLATVTASATKTASTVNAIAAVPAVTKTASVEKAAVTVNAVAQIPAVTKTASVEKLATTVALVAQIPAVTKSASVEKNATSVNVVALIPAVTKTASVEKAASTVNVVAFVPQAAAFGEGAVTVLPATVNAVAGVPPVLVIASATKNAVTVNALVTIPPVTKTATATVFAVTINLIAGIPLVTVEGAEVPYFYLEPGGGPSGPEAGSNLIGAISSGTLVGRIEHS